MKLILASFFALLTLAGCAGFRGSIQEVEGTNEVAVLSTFCDAKFELKFFDFNGNELESAEVDHVTVTSSGTQIADASFEVSGVELKDIGRITVTVTEINGACPLSVGDSVTWPHIPGTYGNIPESSGETILEMKESDGTDTGLRLHLRGR